MLAIDKHAVEVSTAPISQSQLQQTTFINIFSLFYRENKT